MIELNGNIFGYIKPDSDADAICIFTNGITNKYGQAMAGAGQAGAAANRWWNFRYKLGSHLLNNGNTVGLIGKIDFFTIKSESDYDEEIREATMLESYSHHRGRICIISFPTKEHFNKPSIPELIVKSANDLVKMSNELKFKKVILGRPGCGRYTGRLNWETDVKPLIEKILDDRFVILNNE